jgi:hypothetical protein
MEMKKPHNFIESGGQYPPVCQISMSRQIIDRMRLEGSTCSVFFNLPPYSPELNPQEYLNQDVKTNALLTWIKCEAI